MSVNFEIADIPEIKIPPPRGRWNEAMEAMLLNPPGKSLKFTPRLTMGDCNGLRAAGKVRGFAVHIRQVSDCTYAWRGDEVESYRAKAARLKESK